MANTIRIKRRANGGGSGAPASLANAELAYNEQTDTLYYGKGTGGANGTATTAEPIGGRGAYVALSGDQIVYGSKSWADGQYINNLLFVYPVGHSIVTPSINQGIYTTQARFYASASNYATILDGNITATGTGAFTGNVSAANPTQDGHLATKSYVDAVARGLDWKPSVRAATTSNITLSGLQTIDGVSVSAGDRVLVKAQTTASQNGIYVAAVGTWTRATDFSATGGPNGTSSVSAGATVFVSEGTSGGNTSWTLTTDDSITLDTTPLTFAQISGSGSEPTVANVGSSGIGVYFAKSGNELQFRKLAAGTGISVATDATDNGRLNISISTHGHAIGDITDLSTELAGKQAADTTLTALAGVTTAANKLIYATGADTFTTTDLSSFGRTLIDDANASAARSTLELGSMATQAANSVNITGGSVDGITLDGGTF